MVFVIGGITRSELRVAHLMSAKLGRDVVLGSNVVDTPTSYLQRLQVRLPGLPKRWSIMGLSFSLSLPGLLSHTLPLNVAVQSALRTQTR